MAEERFAPLLAIRSPIAVFGIDCAPPAAVEIAGSLSLEPGFGKTLPSGFDPS